MKRVREETVRILPHNQKSGLHRQVPGSQHLKFYQSAHGKNDLRAFNQILVAEDKRKTAITTLFGLYEFPLMTFIRKAPKNFQPIDRWGFEEFGLLSRLHRGRFLVLCKYRAYAWEPLCTLR